MNLVNRRHTAFAAGDVVRRWREAMRTPDTEGQVPCLRYGCVTPDATAFTGASVTTLTAIVPSPGRGDWCTSLRSVMTTYAAIWNYAGKQLEARATPSSGRAVHSIAHWSHGSRRSSARRSEIAA